MSKFNYGEFKKKVAEENYWRLSHQLFKRLSNATRTSRIDMKIGKRLVPESIKVWRVQNVFLC